MGREMEMQPIEPSASGSTARRRVVVGIIAAMLVAAAGGVGYGLGRSVGDEASSAATEPTVSPTTIASALDAIDTGAINADAINAEDGASVPTSAVEPASTDQSSTISAGGGTAASSGGWGWSMFGAAELPTVFERTTQSGLTVRAQQAEVWDEPAVEAPAGVGDWTPAPWCYESGQLRIALAGNGVIDVAGVGWWREPFRGRAVSWLAMGGVDGQPHWVIVVQAPADVTSITVTFADGATDSVSPQNGVAVLAVPTGGSEVVSTTAGYAAPEFEVSFDGGSEPLVLSSDDVNTWDDPDYRESCSPPPPALPEPGEQPADPAAAEAAIKDVMARLYDASVQGEPGLVVDDTGLAEAREQVAAGGYAGEADSAQATVEAIVFTSPTEAWFRYRIDTDGIGLDDRFGVAQFVDGSWKVTRDTVCQDLSMAGGDCGAGWQQVFPPGFDVMEGD